MSNIRQLVHIKNTTLLFIVGIVLIFTTVILYFAMDDKKEHIDKKIELKIAQLDLAFTKKVFELQNKYNERLESFISNNQDIIEAFANRDRKKLDKLTQIKLDKLMKENPNFELICFGLPDMTAFYRAHMPKKFGDDISKVQGVQTVTKLKKRVSGFLVAKLGLYYRVTFPVFKNGKYIGVIAFGININYVNDHIYEKFGAESAIIVDTKTLRQSKWYDMLEEGTIGKYTTISSNGELISRLAKSNQNIDSKNILMNSDDKVYNVINNININGIHNKPIAKVILFQDITKEHLTYKKYLYTFVTVLIILIIMLTYALIKTFNKFLNTIVLINDDLKELNTNLEDRVEKEVQINREKEEQLFNQSKRAQLGDMIENIAHQWRQPLSAISTSVSGIQVQKELGILTDDSLDKSIDIVLKTTNHLSETIESFRDFLSQKKEYSDFIVQDEIDKNLNILNATLKNNNIDIIKEYTKTPLMINSIAGEISQVILNIIDNAKDILLEKNISNKQIIIAILKQNNNYVQITIEDNAGGIEKDIITKIFDPYFTTKHQSQGTGLGLHMSYKIITESLKGKLYVENTQKGAKFFIELPLQ